MLFRPSSKSAGFVGFTRSRMWWAALAASFSGVVASPGWVCARGEASTHRYGLGAGYVRYVPFHSNWSGALGGGIAGTGGAGVTESADGVSVAFEYGLHRSWSLLVESCCWTQKFWLLEGCKLWPFQLRVVPLIVGGRIRFQWGRLSPFVDLGGGVYLQRLQPERDGFRAEANGYHHAPSEGGIAWGAHAGGGIACEMSSFLSMSIVGKAVTVEKRPGWTKSSPIERYRLDIDGMILSLNLVARL